MHTPNIKRYAGRYLKQRAEAKLAATAAATAAAGDGGAGAEGDGAAAPATAWGSEAEAAFEHRLEAADAVDAAMGDT